MGSLTPAADLARLARRINAAHAAAERSFRAGLEHARAAGALLAAAKAQLGHGEWLPWLRANVRFSVRTVQLYMRLAERWPQLEGKCATVAHLTFREALEALARQSGGRGEATDEPPDRRPRAAASLEALVRSGRRFGTLLVDPPWPYANRRTRGAAAHHYRTAGGT